MAVDTGQVARPAGQFRQEGALAVADLQHRLALGCTEQAQYRLQSQPSSQASHEAHYG